MNLGIKTKLTVITALSLSCNGVEFGAQSRAGKASQSKAAEAQAPSTPPTPAAPVSPTTAAPATPTEPPVVIDDAAKCWFAVSGAYFGFSVMENENQYGNVFPETTSGKPIKTGERFDLRSGGVFLNSRQEPYEYKKGGMEIDPAVETTFDSIAVSPGVMIELRNGSGDIVYQGSGPYMAISSFGPTQYVSNWLKTRKSKMPPWMARYLEERSYRPIVLDGLSPGPTTDYYRGVVWVKVTKIPGVSCE